MDLEKIGKMSDALDDLTPIQIGTTGMFSGEKFEVIGRLKVGYDGGFWNEWYTFFGSEKIAWLVEAQGFFGLCFPYDGVTVPDQESVKVGRIIDFGKAGYFEIEDMREVSCIFSEGELPMNAVEGRKSLSVDLTGPDDSMATIEYAAHQRRVFLGDYIDFDEFQFKNLRPIDGW
jgi:hypothetical protein